MLEKLADDCKWGKDMVDLLCDYRTSNAHTDLNRKEIISNYKLFNNIIDQEDFEKECNPLGLEVGQFKDEIKPYNKTYNKIQVLLGEELKRPFTFRAVITSPEGIKSKVHYRTQMLQEYVQSLTESIAAEAKAKIGQVDPEQAQQLIQNHVDNVLPPDKIDAYMKTSYQNSMEILSNKILDVLMFTEDIKAKKNDGYKHALLSDGEFILVTSKNLNPCVEVVNSASVFYHKNKESKFIEDGMYAGHVTKMNPQSIMSEYGKSMSEEDLEKFATRYDSGRQTSLSSDMKYSSYDPIIQGLQAVEDGYEGSYGSSNMQDITVVRVEWVSERKLGKLTFTNDYGETESKFVSENYVVPEYALKLTSKDSYGNKTYMYEFDGQTLEWMWLPEVWSGVKIDDDIYVNVGPKPYQHRDPFNPMKHKLGYHGMIYNNMNAGSCSLMSRMKPYQFLYFIVAHKMKQLIGRDKGQAFTIDTTMIDPQIGLEKTMYYLEELDLNFINPLQNAERPGAAQRSTVSNAVSRSNMQHIMQYIQVLEALDQQISDVAGISKGREGQQSPNETVGNNRQALLQSATITEAYFFNHNRIWERVLNSLLDLSVYLWKDQEVVRTYVLDDLSNHTLLIKPDDLSLESMLVRVLESSKQHEAFEFAKQHFLELLQNDRAKFSDILQMFQTNSLAEYTVYTKQQEEKQDQAQQAQQQAEQELREKELQIQIDLLKLKHDNDMELQKLKNEGDLEQAEIDVFKFQKDLDSDNNGVPDPLEVERLKIETMLKSRDLDIKEEKVAVDRIKANSAKTPKKS